jgi:hypothetical protein
VVGIHPGESLGKELCLVLFSVVELGWLKVVEMTFIFWRSRSGESLKLGTRRHI